MKNLIAAAVFGMVAFSVAAKPIAFNFSKVDLNKFLDATYGGNLQASCRLIANSCCFS